MPTNFGVFCKLANLLMSTVSEENTVKCLEGPSDFGNGRTSLLILGNLRQSSRIFGSLGKSEINCRKMAENSLIY